LDPGNVGFGGEGAAIGELGRAIPGLSQYATDGHTGNIGEAELPTLEEVSQFFMVDAHLIKDGGVQIVDRTWIANHVVSEIVGLPDHGTGLDASAGHPDREAAGMMVPSIVAALGEDGAAELAAPHHQGII
jgi:hypothetical protein